MNVNDLNASEIARYHNEALRLYYSSNESIGTIRETQEKVTLLMNKNYPELMEGFSVPADYNFIRIAYERSDINEPVFEEILNSSFEQLVSKNHISKEISSKIKDLTWASNPVEEKNDCLNNIKLEARLEDEIKFLDVYQSVLVESNSYWVRRDTNQNTARRVKDDSVVAAADAVGAVTGLYGGPVWSILQGALVSIAVIEGNVAPREEIELPC